LQCSTSLIGAGGRVRRWWLAGKSARVAPAPPPQTIPTTCGSVAHNGPSSPPRTPANAHPLPHLCFALGLRHLWWLFLRRCHPCVVALLGRLLLGRCPCFLFRRLCVAVACNTFARGVSVCVCVCVCVCGGEGECAGAQVGSVEWVRMCEQGACQSERTQVSG
jgi:hypothetical protein